MISWTSVFKACWRQGLMVSFGSGAAWCYWCWRFLGCPQFTWWSRAWHQLLFLRVLWNVIGLWCNGIPSCYSRFTQLGMAGTSMHAQASEKSQMLHLKPCQMFSQMWLAMGIAWVWSACQEFEGLMCSSMFCPRLHLLPQAWYISAVTQFSTSTVEITTLP